jgi:DNA-binding LytR/AlgR family response regulator
MEVNQPQKVKKLRILKPRDYSQIVYIRHLGKQPYNEIKFECGRKLIVCYSLNYWQTLFQDFTRVNRSVLVNPAKIIRTVDSQEVILIDNSSFIYSRRMSKKYCI